MPRMHPSLPLLMRLSERLSTMLVGRVPPNGFPYFIAFNLTCGLHYAATKAVLGRCVPADGDIGSAMPLHVFV